ncbi:MAG: DUF4147 domain-containing protein [Gemmatimonadota bacterium]|nr:DUF4147 domain-containing protein [Gemmatimonadota bacterium]
MTARSGQLTRRDLLTDLYWTAVQAAAPGPALRAALAGRTTPPGRRIHLLALGKAALPMAETAVAVLAEQGTAPVGGLLVVPEPAVTPHPNLLVAVGQHPQPGTGSLAAAEQLASAVAAVEPGDEVWVLLSGGTTSLVGAPIPSITTGDLAALYRLLLGSGLDITAMNRVRKRFARWAGGRLAAALAHAHVKSFTISDVIGDDLGAIGSGPCVPDPSSAADIRTVLEAAQLWDRVPLALRSHLDDVEQGRAAETPKPDHPAFAATKTTLIASNRLALDAVLGRARSLGYRSVLVNAALAGEAAVVGHQIAAILLGYNATNLSGAQVGEMNKDAVLVWGGETTVTLTPDAGLGGRSQELALAAAEVLDGTPGSGVLLLAAGTDGRDGPTDAAGGFAEPNTWNTVRRAGRDPASDLAHHRSHAALEAAGALFTTGMTGTNVMDLVIGIVPVPA